MSGKGGFFVVWYNLPVMTYEERMEQVEALKKKKERGEELTLEEQKLLNLSKTMIKPGEVRNPEGRKKGAINWSTRIKRLMGDEKLLKSVISELPANWQGIVENTPADVIAASLIVSATRQSAENVAKGSPIDEQTLKVIDRISKIGYGDKVVMDAEDGFFEKTQINFNVVPDRRSKDDES